jgi:hypothetical protein
MERHIVANNLNNQDSYNGDRDLGEIDPQLKGVTHEQFRKSLLYFAGMFNRTMAQVVHLGNKGHKAEVEHPWLTPVE